jgi:hypothetical protein
MGPAHRDRQGPPGRVAPPIGCWFPFDGSPCSVKDGWFFQRNDTYNVDGNRPCPLPAPGDGGAPVTGVAPMNATLAPLWVR